MIEIRKAQVKSIIKSDEFVQEISLVIDHPNKKAINYPKITGTLKVGDRVMAVSYTHLGTDKMQLTLLFFAFVTSRKLCFAVDQNTISSLWPAMQGRNMNPTVH